MSAGWPVTAAMKRASLRKRGPVRLGVGTIVGRARAARGAGGRNGAVRIMWLIRMRLLKEDQRQNVEALQTAVLGLVYRVQEDLA
jgi:hypothetical protein